MKTLIDIYLYDNWANPESTTQKL